MPNYYPGIPEPVADDVKSIHNTVMALKEAVETLTDQRGTSMSTSVTWADLVRLKLISETDVPR